MSTSIDLWGTDFDFAVTTPGSILKEQASLLSTKTQGLVTAEVDNKPFGSNIQHIFKLVVPAMDFYKYELFRLVHGIDLYPGDIFWNNDHYPFKDEQSLLSVLATIFRSAPTMKVISSLVAQAKE